MSEVLVHIVLVLCKGGYDMGNFLVIIMIYSGGKPLTVTVIMFWYPKIVLGLVTGGVPLTLVHIVHKTCIGQLL